MHCDVQFNLVFIFFYISIIYTQTLFVYAFLRMNNLSGFNGDKTFGEKSRFDLRKIEPKIEIKNLDLFRLLTKVCEL